MRPLDLDKRRPAVVAAEQQVAEPGRQTVDFPQINQHFAVELLAVNPLALPCNPRICAKHNTMLRQGNAYLILNVSLGHDATLKAFS